MVPGDAHARRPAHQRVASLVADAMLKSQEAGDSATSGMHNKTLHIVPDLLSGFRGSVPADVRLDFYLHPQGEAEAPLDSASTLGTEAVILSDRDRVILPTEVLLNDVTNDMSVTIVMEANVGGELKPMAKATVPSAAFCDALQCSEEYEGPALHSLYHTHVITTLKLALNPTANYQRYCAVAGLPGGANRLTLECRAGWEPLGVNFAAAQEPGAEPQAAFSRHADSGVRPTRLPRLQRAMDATGAHNGEAVAGAAEDEGDGFTQQRVPPSPPPAKGDVAGEVFSLLDVSREDLMDATFTMQEMMDLAMLHTQQMQMMQLSHEAEVEALHEHYSAKEMKAIEVQTDPLAEPDPPEEKVVEVVVEKVIEKVVEKLVREVVTEYVYVNKGGQGGKPTDPKPDYGSAIPDGVSGQEEAGHACFSGLVVYHKSTEPPLFLPFSFCSDYSCMPSGAWSAEKRSPVSSARKNSSSLKSGYATVPPHAGFGKLCPWLTPTPNPQPRPSHTALAGN